MYMLTTVRNFCVLSLPSEKSQSQLCLIHLSIHKILLRICYSHCMYEYSFSQKEDNGSFRAYSSGQVGAKHNPTDSNLTICAQQRKSKLRMASRARGWKADGSRFEAFLCTCHLYPGKASFLVELQFPCL